MAGATLTQIFLLHERIGGTCGLVQHNCDKSGRKQSVYMIFDDTHEL